MYNYNDLSPNDFELICKDILSVKTGQEIRTFAPGRDGGIDARDSKGQNEHVLQAKHFLKSTFTTLFNQLKKEKEKIQKLTPPVKNYYVYTSFNLTANNITQIYDLFADYMESEDNVMGQEQIEDFLQNNPSVVEKHYKLWLASTQILDRIQNGSILIDEECFFFEIEKTAKEFVKTDYYEQCKNVLTEKRILMILGNPGVGKTMTSKMLALYFATEGYKIRYSSSNDLKSLKNAISLNKLQKEFILLDDSIGQRYLELQQSDVSEIVSLIKYVLQSPNKILLLNSRVTVFEEAKRKVKSFSTFIEDEYFNISKLNISNLSDREKALILYNRICFQDMPDNLKAELLDKERILKIIRHRNYNPRLIEHVTKKVFYRNCNSENYYSHIIESLNKPNELWREDYENCLEKIDRIFVNTLYSITEDHIEKERLKVAFDYRISKAGGFDTSKNLYWEVVNRLNESYIYLSDKYVHIINPSLNDFLDKYLEDNPNELQNIKRYSCDLQQVMFGLAGDIKDLITSHKILDYYYNNENLRTIYIAHQLALHDIKDSAYEEILQAFISVNYAHINNINVGKSIEIISWLKNESIVLFYKLEPKIIQKITAEIMREVYLGTIWDWILSSGKDVLLLKSRILPFQSEIKKQIEENLYEWIENSGYDDFLMDHSEFGDGQFEIVLPQSEHKQFYMTKHLEMSEKEKLKEWYSNNLNQIISIINLVLNLNIEINRNKLSTSADKVLEEYNDLGYRNILAYFAGEEYDYTENDYIDAIQSSSQISPDSEIDEIFGDLANKLFYEGD